MALPYNFTVTCKAINEWPAVPEVEDASNYAYVEFEKADAEASADEMQAPQGTPLPQGRLVFRIHQAQKDDFTVGTDYTLSIQ